MSKNMLVIIGVLLVLLVGGVLFINSSRNSTPSPTPVATQSTTDSAPEMSPETALMDSTSSGSPTAMTDGSVKEFTVMGSAFKFEPATLTVNKGDKVKITFKNLGGTHDFVIDELDVNTQTIQSGQDETVEFTASEAGSFEYYCSVGNHRQMGMKGTLVVK